MIVRERWLCVVWRVRKISYHSLLGSPTYFSVWTLSPFACPLFSGRLVSFNVIFLFSVRGTIPNIRILKCCQICSLVQFCVCVIPHSLSFLVNDSRRDIKNSAHISTFPHFSTVLFELCQFSHLQMVSVWLKTFRPNHKCPQPSKRLRQVSMEN